MKKKLPIGISDFREIIEDNYYYADKSLLVKELVDNGSKTVLFPRPRRFGKTLGLSMLRYFYEKTEQDTSGLFHQLAIWEQGEAYTRKQGQYPVIYLTFKDIKSRDWAECSIKLKEVISGEYLRHKSLLNAEWMDSHEKKVYREIIDFHAGPSSYENSLRKLSAWLESQYGQKTVILIDEYDTPIQQGYLHGYYDEVIDFMRNLLGSALKDNISLEKGVLTGILRVAKESIFSGLNNLEVCSVLVPDYSTRFGLLESEVEAMLEYYEVGVAPEEVKDWYNGYVFGGTTIYNPWSLINFAAKWRNGLQPYWVNTSSNDLVRQILTESGPEVKKELERLVQGESIRKTVDDNIVFRDIRSSVNALWSFLLFSGYLKIKTDTLVEGIHHCDLLIPNREVAVLYRQIILGWFETSIHSEHHRMMLEALLNGETDTFEDIFQDIMLKTFSMFDIGGEEPEKVYHAFVLGLLVSLRDTHEVKSNRESGYGRYDVMLIPKNPCKKGIIIEFKKAKRGETLEDAVVAALRQIEEKNYESELQIRGVHDILKLGIAFEGKKVCIRSS